MERLPEHERIVDAAPATRHTLTSSRYYGWPGRGIPEGATIAGGDHAANSMSFCHPSRLSRRLEACLESTSLALLAPARLRSTPLYPTASLALTLTQMRCSSSRP